MTGPADLRVVRRTEPSHAGLRSLAVVFGCFKVSEYGSWITVTIFANHRGGVREAAAVLVASLVPATIAALGVGALLARHGSRVVLVGGLLVQLTGLLLLAVSIQASLPVIVSYAAAVLAATAMVTTRPSISALLPALTPDPRSITRAHVLLGWFDGAASLVGPALAAVLLSLAGFPAAFAVFAVITAVATVRALLIRSGLEDVVFDSGTAPKLASALRAIAGAAGPRSGLLLLAAQGFLIGCLDLLVVVAANGMNGDPSTAGWFGAALGAGAMIGGTASVVLIGRQHLWPAAVGAGALVGCAVAALSVAHEPGPAAVIFVVVGALASILLVAGTATLQRLTDLRLLAHVFAAAEATESAVLLLGALVVPLLVALLGMDGTFVAIGGLLIATAVVIARPLIVAEQGFLGASLRVEALRGAEALAHLGAATLEGLARAAEPHAFAPGARLMSQGEPGEDYHVIVSGQVAVTLDGLVVNRLGPGSGVGELALLFNTPRTATVTAVDDVTTLSLNRETFLLALTQQPPPSSWDAVVQSRLATRAGGARP